MKYLTVSLLVALSSVAALGEEMTWLTKEVLAAKRASIVEAQTAEKPAQLTSSASVSARNPFRRSSFLTFDGKWTFVPEGAVLHIPPRFQARVTANQPEGKMVPFSTFFQSNFGWLKTQVVTSEQILGSGSSSNFREALGESNYVVVATRNGFPVSTRQDAKTNP